MDATFVDLTFRFPKLSRPFSPSEIRPGGSARSRLTSQFWRLCDALVTASIRPRASSWAHARLLFGRRTRHYDRAAAALGFIDSVLPGAARAWAKLALRGTKLPLRCSDLKPMAFGTGDTVFTLAGSPEGSVVCKVERRTLGRSASELLALARWKGDAYRSIVQDYAAVRDVFPDARFLVGHGPMFGVPAVLALQMFVEGRKRDILRDVPIDEIRELVACNPRLRAQVSGFFPLTIEAWEHGAWVVDLGPDNLVLVGEGDGARLVYLDVEMKEVRRVRGSVREGMYRTLIERMRAILSVMASEPAKNDIAAR